MELFSPSTQMIVLPLLALVYLFTAMVDSRCEIKGHFSFFAKLIMGFCIGAFAVDIIAYIASGRQVSLSGVTGMSDYTSSSGLSAPIPSSSGNGMPWDGILDEIFKDLEDYVVIVVGGIAFVVGGIVYMFGVGSRAMRFALTSSHSTENQATFAEWKNDLDKMVRSDVSLTELKGWRRVFRHIHPKLMMLPAWWPWQGYGAWSYMRYILISGKLAKDAPPSVRRYVLGHELGHIRFGHTALNYMYPVTSVLFLTAMGVFLDSTVPETKTIAAFILLALLVPKSALLWFPNRREYQADRYAVAVNSTQEAIEGSLWMAEHGQDRSALRQKRLLRLGYGKTHTAAVAVNRE
ncbi:M48 family metalloprotease [Acidithiobacillus thiooxidans]|uniref:Peptidase M48 domain-containing protein n=1 Tax=Acidithiobacillus thiooxidans ATCC 19377 TaxID=637390 RepID=A0A5P9XQL8_ACITH|nr:M48 family metalloprotease [Acidithiobacillus thiooxidans]MBU2753042.1 M48 family metalloprotease [Acidithiobacillus thiooxidans]QFX96152.1 hypothetical protein GCD22_01877 [Acidithiobacillus thiooxidans ATCC 19377]